MSARRWIPRRPAHACRTDDGLRRSCGRTTGPMVVCRLNVEAEDTGIRGWSRPSAGLESTSQGERTRLRRAARRQPARAFHGEVWTALMRSRLERGMVQGDRHADRESPTRCVLSARQTAGTHVSNHRAVPQGDRVDRRAHRVSQEGRDDRRGSSRLEGARQGMQRALGYQLSVAVRSSRFAVMRASTRTVGAPAGCADSDVTANEILRITLSCDPTELCDTPRVPTRKSNERPRAAR